MSTKIITISLKRNYLFLVGAVIIVTTTIFTIFWAQAAFLGPSSAPGASSQDFTNNILGADNTDNEFSSDLVTSSSTGSIIERLEYIRANYVDECPLVSDYSLQKNQIWDDWKDSASSTANDLSYAYSNTVDRNLEEATWASTTDTSLGSETVASGVVKKDERTELYWSDCYSVAQDGSCDIITNSFTLDGSVADTDDGLDAEGGNAVDFCESLSLAVDETGDKTDWYLPSQKELLQAYIDGSGNNIPNPANDFWSSTEYYNAPANAWHVNLSSGYTYSPH